MIDCFRLHVAESRVRPFVVLDPLQCFVDPKVPAEPCLAAIETGCIWGALRWGVRRRRIVKIQAIAILQTRVVGLSRIYDMRASLAAENLEGEVLSVSKSSILISRGDSVRL
jgi:hypothetical protein